MARIGTEQGRAHVPTRALPETGGIGNRSSSLKEGSFSSVDQRTKAEETKAEETKAEEKDAAQGSDMGPPAKKAKVTAPDIAKYEPARYESITLTMPVIEPIKAAAPKLTRAKTIYPKGSY